MRRQVALNLSPFLLFFLFSLSEDCAETPTEKLTDFIGETGTHRDCAEKESWN